MKKCKNCGIAELDKARDLWFCLKYKKHMNEQEVNKEYDCSYFTPVRYEQGEALSSFEHLLLQEQEIKDKKMKGPI